MRTRQMRYRYMGNYRLGLLSAALAVWVLFLDLSLSAFGIAIAGTAVADTGSQATPTAPADRLIAVQKRIVLRTEDGSPVPGIGVRLAPADPTLGGPENSAEVQTATTGPDGTATFSRLGQWVWMVSFSGSSDGKAVQPVEEQGKAPYGRTRAGGGFPVVVQRQEEEAPATPIVVQGTPLPEVQPSVFVLVPVEGKWVPTLDLALPGEQPLPLSNIQNAAAPPTTPQPPAVTSGASTRTGGTSPAEESLDNVLRWLYLLPAGIGLFAILRAWQDWRGRRQESQQGRAHTNTRTLEDAR